MNDENEYGVSAETWGALTAQAYGRYLEYALQPSPWMDLWRKQNQEWWANQTRLFKLRYRVRHWCSSVWYESRRAIADRIFPEGRDW